MALVFPVELVEVTTVVAKVAAETEVAGNDLHWYERTTVNNGVPFSYRFRAEW